MPIWQQRVRIQYRGIINCQYHLDVYLRYPMPCLCKRSRTIITLNPFSPFADPTRGKNPHPSFGGRPSPAGLSRNSRISSLDLRPSRPSPPTLHGSYCSTLENQGLKILNLRPLSLHCLYYHLTQEYLSSIPSVRRVRPEPSTLDPDPKP